MGISSMWQHLAGLKHVNEDPWIQPDQKPLSCTPISNTDNTSKSQLSTNNILPSKPHDKKSVSSEFLKMAASTFLTSRNNHLKI
jgi:hypothetical protein